MKKNNIKLLALAILSVLFIACDVSYLDKDIDDITWTGGAQLPIGSVSFKLSDLLEEVEIDDLDKDGSNNYFVTYPVSINAGDVDNFDTEITTDPIVGEIVTPITNQTFIDYGDGSTLTVPNPVPDVLKPYDATSNPSGIKSETTQEIQHFSLSQELTSADFKSGKLIIAFTSTFGTPIDLNISIPSLKKDNIPYSKVITVTSTTPNEEIPLSNYKIDLTTNDPTSGTDYNNILIDVIASFNIQAGETLSNTDKLTYTATLDNAKTEVVYGDFKNEAFTISQAPSISLDFFDSFGEGAITFSDATMTIDATNPYGFPIGVDVSGIEAINGGNTTGLELKSPLFTNHTIKIDGVAAYSNPIVPKVTSTITLTKDNSNLNELLSIKPSEIKMNVSGELNPDSGAGVNSNFYAETITDLDVDINVNVPLKVKFEDIELTESIDFDNADDLDDINDIKLTLTSVNSIPLSGTVELNFFNGDTDLFVSKTITAFDAAAVDNSGNVTGTTTKSSVLEFSESDITAIKTATRIDAVFTLNTPDSSNEESPTVQLNAEDGVTITLGVDANISTTQN